MSRVKYKAIYAPISERRHYHVVDAQTLAEVTETPIVLYRLYHDGSSAIHSQKAKKTEEEQKIYEMSKVYLEFKHDG